MSASFAFLAALLLNAGRLFQFYDSSGNPMALFEGSYVRLDDLHDFLARFEDSLDCVDGQEREISAEDASYLGATGDFAPEPVWRCVRGRWEMIQ